MRSSLNVVKPPTRAFSRAASGRLAVPGTPTTRSPAPSMNAISAVSAVRQTTRRGKSTPLSPYTSDGESAWRPLHLGESTQQEPAGQGLRPLSGPLEHYGARAKRLVETQVSEPDHRNRLEVGGHDDVGPEAGILQAEVDLRTLQDEPQGPEPAIARRHASKIEADDHPLGRQPIDSDPPVDVPHEERRVEVLRAHLPVDPALAPLAEPVDDGPELFTGPRQPVLSTPPSGQGDARNDAALLESLQALGEKRA